MLCWSRQVALPRGGKDKSKTHRGENPGNRSNRRYLSNCDKLTDDQYPRLRIIEIDFTGANNQVWSFDANLNATKCADVVQALWFVSKTVLMLTSKTRTSRIPRSSAVK